MPWAEKAQRFYRRQVPILAFLAFSSWALCVRFLGIRPPIGSQIAILAFLAAIVTIWPPEGRWGKALWVLVFFGLTVLEITGLYRDSKEAAEARAKEDAAFSHLLEQEKQIVGQVTGDDGFVYLDILSIPVDKTGASLTAIVHGEYPIRQVMYDLIEGPPPHYPTAKDLNEIISGRHLNMWIGDMPIRLVRTLNRVIHPPLDKEGFDIISIFALNGHVGETLQTRYERTTSTWNRKIIVKGEGDKVVLSLDWLSLPKTN